MRKMADRHSQKLHV